MEGRRLEAAVFGRRFPGGLKHMYSGEYELPDNNHSLAVRVKEILIQLKKDFNVGAVVFGLEPEKFARLEIEMPVMKEGDLKSALSFELEKHLPLLPEEYAFDFRKVSSGRNKIKLLVYAVKKESLNWINESLNGTGIKLKGIRCSLLEFLEEFAVEHKNPNALVAYMGKEKCYIARPDTNLPVLVKAVPAEKALVEIESIKAGQVFIAGEGSGSFESALPCERIPFRMADVLASSPGRRRGLDFRTERVSGKDLYGKALWVAASLCLILYLITPLYSYFKDLSTEKRIEKEINSLKSGANEFLEMRREMDELREKERFLLKARSEVNRPIKALSSLSRTLPKEAWLSSFSIDEKGKVEIKGFSKKSALLINPLEKSNIFKNVEFSAPVYTREGWERFSIKMELEE